MNRRSWRKRVSALHRFFLQPLHPIIDRNVQ
jgi:hypothetical protein